MPSLVKHGEAKVVTKDGEVFVNITLELNIKLEGTGAQVSASAAGVGGSTAAPIDDKVNWEIPDFSPSKIEFGK
jgi:hypothetical protein